LFLDRRVFERKRYNEPEKLYYLQPKLHAERTTAVKNASILLLMLTFALTISGCASVVSSVPDKRKRDQNYWTERSSEDEEDEDEDSDW